MRFFFKDFKSKKIFFLFLVSFSRRGGARGSVFYKESKSKKNFFLTEWGGGERERGWGEWEARVREFFN